MLVPAVGTTDVGRAQIRSGDREPMDVAGGNSVAWIWNVPVRQRRWTAYINSIICSYRTQERAVNRLRPWRGAGNTAIRWASSEPKQKASV